MLTKKKQKISHPITRAASFSLVFALTLVCLPLAGVLPPGIMAIAALAVVWRLVLLRAKWQEPGWLVRTLVVALALVIILLHYRTLLGLEAGAATLVAAYALKLLEMHSRRDALLLTFLGFFVAVTGLLFSQSIPMALYLCLCLVILTSVLIGIYQPAERTEVKPVLVSGAKAALQAIPLTLLLFVLVPRIPPLWSVPLPDNSARTGLSDEMSPGDIARLSQSDELAFRATFTGEAPPPEQRYWRAVVMHWFDGRRWYQGEQSDWLRYGVSTSQLVSWYPQSPLWEVPEQSADSYRYEIILEPSGRPWLPVLGPVQKATAEAGLTRDWRLLAEEPVNLRRRYQLASGLTGGYDRDLPDWLRRASLQLPELGNSRTRAFAQQLRSVHNGDARAIVQGVLRRFREQGYFYTLRPPVLPGANAIDDFLFTSQRGFCAHYAGALTFILRAAGIPARVVAGYQGGEEKGNGVIQVRQFDAHAWVEVWLPGEGWQRVDPTAAVAPERVERGLEDAVASEGSFLEQSPFSPVRYRDVGWINTLRLEYENLEYQWQRLVLSYDEDAQRGLFQRLFPGQDVLTTLSALLGAGLALVMLVGSLLLLRPWRNSLPETERLYQIFCQRMARRGLVRQPGEGPEHFSARIASECPELGQYSARFTGLYIRLTYGRPEPNDLAQLRQALKRT